METNNEIVLKIGEAQDELKLNNDFIKFTRESKTVLEEKYVPHVIEPSFGIGRIIYMIFEHAFKMRDAQRTYFDFPLILAPVKCSLLPLMA
jgi:glycyl-tRNA synthetase